jgi:hypothetical protein
MYSLLPYLISWIDVQFQPKISNPLFKIEKSRYDRQNNEEKKTGFVCISELDIDGLRASVQRRAVQRDSVESFVAIFSVLVCHSRFQKLQGTFIVDGRNRFFSAIKTVFHDPGFYPIAPTRHRLRIEKFQ